MRLVAATPEEYEQEKDAKIMDAISTATIISAALGAIGVIVSAWIGARKVKKHKGISQQLENEITLERAALDFSAFMKEWNELSAQLQQLMDTTCIDRFLILRAWNGKYLPRWTTAVFQMRMGVQEQISYVHYPLDSDYVNRLRELSVKGGMVLKVSELPPSSIKDIYDAEGVKSSYWDIIETRFLNKETVSVTYCSLSTHDDIDIPLDTVVKCKVIIGRLQGLAESQLKGAPNF